MNLKSPRTANIAGASLIAGLLLMAVVAVYVLMRLNS